MARWVVDLGYSRTDIDKAYAWSVTSDIGLTPFIGIDIGGSRGWLTAKAEALVGAVAQAESSSAGTQTRSRAATLATRLQAKLGDRWTLSQALWGGGRDTTIDTLNWTLDPQPLQSTGSDNVPTGSVTDDQTTLRAYWVVGDVFVEHHQPEIHRWSDAFMVGVGYRYAQHQGPFIYSQERDASSVPSQVVNTIGVLQAHAGLLTLRTIPPERLRFRGAFGGAETVLLLPYFDGRMAVGGGALSPTDGFFPAVTGLYGAVELESGVAGHVGHTKWALGYRAATVELWAAEELRSGGIYDIEGGMQSLAGWVMSIQYDL